MVIRNDAFRGSDFRLARFATAMGCKDHLRRYPNFHQGSIVKHMHVRIPVVTREEPNRVPIDLDNTRHKQSIS